jgi:hypothetical protein
MDAQEKHVHWIWIVSSCLPALILFVLMWSDWLPPQIDRIHRSNDFEITVLAVAATMTLLGCASAGMLLRAEISAMPWQITLLSCSFISLLLRAAFESAIRLPFSNISLMLVWMVFAALVHGSVLRAAAWIVRQIPDDE